MDQKKMKLEKYHSVSQPTILFMTDILRLGTIENYPARRMSINLCSVCFKHSST